MGKSHTCWAAIFAIAMTMNGGRCARGQEPAAPSAAWQAKVHEAMPLLGHRNWILIVDSAYPLQNSSGIETIETGAPMEEVLRDVLDDVHHSIHVRPVVYLDAELPFVPEQDAPGVSQYRSELQSMLGARPVTSLPHEALLRKVDDVSQRFKVLILKTNETIPYTSVFLELNCKYWSDDAEARLRTAMKNAGKPSQ